MAVAICAGASEADTLKWVKSEVQACDGVERLRIPGRPGTLYERGIFVPRGPWRHLSESECLCAKTFGEWRTDCMRMVQPETKLANLLFNSKLQNVLQPISWSAAVRSPELTELQTSICREVEALSLVADSTLIQIRRSGLPSTTYDDSERTLIGLHVDNFDQEPVLERRDSRVRLLLNVGQQARSFVCIPKPLPQLLTELDIKPTSENLTHYAVTYRLVHRYLDHFPSTTVLRVRLQPGFGLIAPVQNIAHDGYTAEMTSPDVVISAVLRPL
jgi:hypothetical protein